VAGHQIAIRRAGTGDLERLIALDHRAAAGDAVRLSLLRQSVDDGHCLVHTDPVAIDGFVLVRRRHFFERDFVDLLLVDPLARRRGIGTALMEAALHRAGSSQVFTSTNRSNGPMRGLLERTVWTFSGELDGLDEGDPELVYFKWR
jgi:GNAT superfamily N-acetyltransferase